LYIRVSGNQAGLQMPPTGALRPEEISTLKTWIEQGADWPDELAGERRRLRRIRWPRSAEYAAARRSRDTRSLLKRNPTAARVTGAGGITPLMYAALYGDARSVRLLLDKTRTRTLAMMRAQPR
jgi:hypothetical protein